LDDTDEFGPETITIEGEKLPAGVYKYYVVWYNGSGTWATSNAKIEVYKGNELIRTLIPPSNIASGTSNWNVFTLDSETQEITFL